MPNQWSLINKWRFEARAGENGCRDSYYLPRRATCCGGFAVEDVVMQLLYIDAEDLNKVILLEDLGPRPRSDCPFCGESGWKMTKSLRRPVCRRRGSGLWKRAD